VKWALQQSRGPIGVYALADMLTRSTGKKHFPNSIYRALHRLRDEGDALHVVSANGWVLRKCEPAGPVVVMLCTACGRATQQSGAGLEARLGALSCGEHFKLSHAHLEILGWCRACSKTKAPRVATQKTYEVVCR
jgi:Fe2+ or Zn2+ uptake regulation protein